MVNLCLFWSMLDCYWINRIFFYQSNLIFDHRKSYREFFKRLFFMCSNSFFQKVFNFFSLHTTQSRLQSNFLSFSSVLFARFFSPKAGKTFIFFFFNLFSFFMHFFMHIRDMFGPWKIWGFFMNSAFSFTIDQWVFIGRCYKHNLCCLIWSIGDLRKIGFSGAWNYPNWGFCSNWV